VAVPLAMLLLVPLLSSGLLGSAVLPSGPSLSASVLAPTSIAKALATSGLASVSASRLHSGFSLDSDLSQHSSILDPHSQPDDRRAAAVRVRASSSSSGRQQKVEWVDKALLGVSSSERNEVKQILDLAIRASREWEIKSTNFLNPALIQTAEAALSQSPDRTSSIRWGGYPGSERTKLLVGQEDSLDFVDLQPNALASLPPHESPYGVVCVAIAGNFKFDTSTGHREFLGSILGTGLRREHIGDIHVLPQHKGAIAFVSSLVLGALCGTLTKVGRVPVTVSTVPWPRVAELVALCKEKELSEGKTLTKVENSLRFDSVASAAFGMSRAKAASMIKKGDIQLNWRARQTSTQVEEGDVLSARGFGRATVFSINETKKEKYAIQIHRPA